MEDRFVAAVGDDVEALRADSGALAQDSGRGGGADDDGGGGADGPGLDPAQDPVGRAPRRKRAELHFLVGREAVGVEQYRPEPGSPAAAAAMAGKWLRGMTTSLPNAGPPGEPPFRRRRRWRTARAPRGRGESPVPVAAARPAHSFGERVRLGSRSPAELEDVDLDAMLPESGEDRQEQAFEIADLRPVPGDEEDFQALLISAIRTPPRRVTAKRAGCQTGRQGKSRCPAFSISRGVAGTADPMRTLPARTGAKGLLGRGSLYDLR